MSTKTPNVGDPVVHHGRLHHITGFKDKAIVVQDDGGNNVAALVKLTIFANEGYSVETDADLVWSDEDGAWYLPGRILARNERAVFQAITGAWPPAENHFAVRQMLDVVDLSNVHRGRLAEILKNKKRDLRELIATARGVADLAGEDQDAAEAAVVENYVDACLAQVAKLRDARRGGTNHG